MRVAGPTAAKRAHNGRRSVSAPSTSDDDDKEVASTGAVAGATSIDDDSNGAMPGIRSRGVPRGVVAETCTPRGVSVDSFCFPRGVIESSCGTPRGVSADSGCIPRGVSEDSTCSPACNGAAAVANRAHNGSFTPPAVASDADELEGVNEGPIKDLVEDEAIIV